MASIDLNDDVLIDILFDTLNSFDRNNMQRIVQLVLQDKIDSDRVMEILIEMALSKDFDRRDLAITTLGDLGSISSPTLPILTHMLDNENKYRSRRAIKEILETVTSESNTSIKDILPLLTCEYYPLALDAANAINRINGNYESAVERLIGVLKNGSPKEIKNAIRVLRTIGPGATSALPYLKQYSESIDLSERSYILYTIATIEQSSEHIENSGNGLTK
ncbi:hypothetical protein J7L05_08310 [bacterium]|nr:hypothetical protein [bacterium]